MLKDFNAPVMLRATRKIYAHAAFGYFKDRDSRKALVFEPYILNAGDLIVIEDFDPHVDVRGELWPVRLFCVAINMEKVLAWSKANSSEVDPEMAEKLSNLYPFTRIEFEGDLQRCQETFAITRGKPRPVNQETMNRLIADATAMPSLLNRREWQLSDPLLLG